MKWFSVGMDVKKAVWMGTGRKVGSNVRRKKEERKERGRKVGKVMKGGEVN